MVVSCSRREGLPLNIVEAMLCEKPIVASINRGHWELVTDGASGFLLPPDDPAGFADALEALSKDAELGRKYGMVGREKAQAYQVAGVAKALEKLLFDTYYWVKDH